MAKRDRQQSAGAKSPKGVVAAGHPETAKAGVAILEAGGNAVDAAIAAAFAAAVAEPCLTSLAAGGYMLVHDADSGRQTLLDYFVAMPGEGLKSSGRQMAKLTPAPVDFGGTIQMFHAGPAAVAVPGLAAGLFAAHQRFGSLPIAELVKPAQQLAKRGVRINHQQAFIIEILAGILKLTPESKALFFKQDRPRREGETFRLADYADTLDELAANGVDSFYRGELARQMVAAVEAGGGYLTQADLEGYQVIERQPVATDYRDARLLSNPPPSSGGALIVHTLHLLSQFDLKSFGWQSPEHLRHLAEALAATAEVRQARFDDAVHDEDVLEKLLAEEVLRDDHGKLAKRLGDVADARRKPPGSSSPGKPLESESSRKRLGNTTHISVMDAAGNAVSTTSSNGETAGLLIPGTGILLNNILGEEDLNPRGFHQHPVGHRIPSMMSPSIVMRDGRPLLALGSAGSNRIRSAIIEVISAYLDFGLPIDQAVAAPRVHWENGVIELEGGIPPAVAKQLTTDGYQVNLWKARNLFFGGLQAVGRDAKGLSGAGDQRRGGVAIVAS